MFETNLLILVMILISYFYINLLGWAFWAYMNIVKTPHHIYYNNCPDVTTADASRCFTVKALQGI